MKKSIIVFLTSALLSAVTVAYGWAFVSGQIGKTAMITAPEKRNRLLKRAI